jgi:acetyltransferase-like isoleucine patch superfamily enzyme
MSIRGGFARAVLAARRRAVSALRTWAARDEAELQPGARLIESGAVYNIRGVRGAIKVGTGSVVAGDLLTFAHGGRIAIGSWCYVGANSRIWSAASIDIGDRVLISHNVNIHDCDSHPREPLMRHRQFVAIATSGHPRGIDGIEAAPIRIEDDAWIGFNVTILKGVTVGARSIVGAGSIVTSDIPVDSVVIGNSIRSNT